MLLKEKPLNFCENGWTLPLLNSQENFQTEVNVLGVTFLSKHLVEFEVMVIDF